MAINKTESFIRDHQHRVQLRGYEIIKILLKRFEEHDASKLEEPEFSLWKAMDREPHYPYNDPRYLEKKKRWNHVFEMHYADTRNRHHPEHWCGFYQEMDLLDLIEMLCDWTSFGKFTSEEAIDYIEVQCDRFGFDKVIKDLLLNTFKNYFVITESERQAEELMNPENFDIKGLEKFSG